MANAGVTGYILLADSVDEVGGKIYVLGGAWTDMPFVRTPVRMGLAIFVELPAAQVLDDLRIRVWLTKGRHQVVINSKKVEYSGSLTGPRKTGTNPDVPLLRAIAINTVIEVPEPGAYKWRLSVAGKEVASRAFTVHNPDEG